MSGSLERRHLSSWQKVFVAKDALPFYEAEAKTRMLQGVNQHSSPGQLIAQGSENGRAAELVANAIGTNRAGEY